MVEGVVCGAVGAGGWGLWRGCWAGVSGVPWGWVLGAAEGAIGGVVGVPQGEGAGGRGGGVWWGGTGRRGGGCWGLRWARWRRSAGAVGVGAGGRGEGGGGGQRGAVGVGAGSRGEAGRVRQTASINTPGPPPRDKRIADFDPNLVFPDCKLHFDFTDGYERIHKAWSSIGEVPYCFSRSSIKFQGHTGQKIASFGPNLAFPDCNSILNW